MALKELQIRNIRPTDKVTQCTDERGLYLEVHPNGSKLWRYKYRYMGKQKRLALGRYPDVGLAEARKRRDDARRQLESGTDPLAERKHEKLFGGGERGAGLRRGWPATRPKNGPRGASRSACSSEGTRLIGQCGGRGRGSGGAMAWPRP